MDASRGFGIRHPLHAMDPGLEFELRESSASANLCNDLLVAPHGPFTARDYLNLPALFGRVPLVHAEEVPGKEGCLIAPGASTNFEDDIALVHGILGQESELDLLLQRIALLLELRLLAGSHGAHLGIRLGIGHQRVEIFDLADDITIALHG